MAAKFKGRVIDAKMLIVRWENVNCQICTSAHFECYLYGGLYDMNFKGKYCCRMKRHWGFASLKTLNQTSLWLDFMAIANQKQPPNASENTLSLSLRWSTGRSQ